MTEQKIKDLFTSANPEAPEHYRLHVRNAMERLMEQEEQMKESTKQAVKTAGRYSFKTIAIALLIVMLASAAAMAAIHWNIFDNLSFILGKNVPPAADSLMQKDLYKETVNNVEITVREAGYDGRTLLLQYAYRILDTDEAYGITVEEMYGNSPPEGLEPGTFISYKEEEAEKALRAHNVGWWVDAFWVNGQEMEMAGGSGAEIVGSDVPGEIIHTEYWRLDNIDVALDGPLEISLPIGESQSEEYENTIFDQETGKYTLPDKGIVTFTYDAGDVQSRITKYHPEKETVLPEGTVKVKELSLTPMMTYITMDLAVNPDVMADFIAKNGEYVLDESGNPMFKHGPLDIFEGIIPSMELVDRNGTQLFPDYYGLDALGDNTAMFLYPFIENVPDELWLAPVDDNHVADMSRAVLVKPAK